MDDALYATKHTTPGVAVRNASTFKTMKTFTPGGLMGRAALIGGGAYAAGRAHQAWKNRGAQKTANWFSSTARKATTALGARAARIGENVVESMPAAGITRNLTPSPTRVGHMVGSISGTTGQIDGLERFARLGGARSIHSANATQIGKGLMFANARDHAMVGAGLGGIGGAIVGGANAEPGSRLRGALKGTALGAAGGAALGGGLGAGFTSGKRVMHNLANPDLVVNKPNPLVR